MKSIIRKKINENFIRQYSSLDYSKGCLLKNIETSAEFFEIGQVRQFEIIRQDMKQDPYYGKWLKEEMKNRGIVFSKSSSDPIYATTIPEYETLLINERKKDKTEDFLEKLASAERMYDLTSVVYCDTIFGEHMAPSSSGLKLKEMIGYGKNQNIDDGLLESFYQYAIKHATKRKTIFNVSEKRFYEYRLEIFKTYAYTPYKEKASNSDTTIY